MKKFYSILFIFICVNFLNNVKAQVGETLHPNRGVAMIWYGGQEKIDSRNGVVTVGQIEYRWRFFEPTEGNYQFADLDKQLQTLKNKGLKTTIQINGNRHPDYLYQVVPYLDGVELPSARDHLDGYGPPMYWHPVYKEKYTNLVNALAAHIKASPFKDVVLAVRHNINAVGTEHHFIPTIYRDTTLWTRKPTATWSNEWPWTAEKASEYKTWTIDMFIDAFNPLEDTKLFLRASAISGGDAKARHIEMVEKGDLWIFETSSEPQPRNSGKDEQYQVFVDYAKTGKTLAYMESWSSANTTSDEWEWTLTSTTMTKAQFNYWTLLVDLHCGATWPAMRPEDIDYPTFRAHYEFAAKYAGYIAAPKKTPGAWIAFREGDKLVGDYTFLMKRSSGDNSLPLYNVDNAPEGLWARQISQGNSMSLDFNPEFAGSMLNRQGVSFTVTYKDVGTDNFRVDAFGQSFTHTRTGTGAWLKFTKQIDVGEITNFQIFALNSPLTLHMVEVNRGGMSKRGDVDPPTAPGSLLLTDSTQTSCSLAWSPSTDAVGVTGYMIYKNGELETTVTGTATTILGLNCGTKYIFTVKSRDAAGNISESSNVVNATTLVCAYSDALYSENFDDNLAQGWIADSTDKWTVANGKYSTVRGGLYTSIFYGLKFKNYIFKADAYPHFKNDFGVIFDFIDNNNYYIMILDAEPQTARLVKVENGVNSTVATSTYTIGGYKQPNNIVIKNSGTDVLVTVNGTVVFNNIPITPSDSARIGLWVERNPVDFDNIEVLENIDIDNEPPSQPTNILVSNVTETSFDLSWDASSDNKGIAAYKVFKDNLLHTIVRSNTLSVSELSCGKSYNFFIIAVDFNNNISDTSSVENFSTSACSDVLPPTAPGSLTVSQLEQNSMHLSWLASEDNIGITAYNVYLNDIFETAFFTTSGKISGLECGQTYSVTVKAKDAAGNVSEASIMQEVTTLNCHVGVNEMLNNDHILIYPVPFKDELNIKFTGLTGQAVVNMFNALGIKVYSKQLPVGENTILTITDEMKPGFYFIHIEQNNRFYYKQVVK